MGLRCHEPRAGDDGVVVEEGFDGERLAWLEVHSIERDDSATVLIFSKP
jgi:hypothetical protein